MYDSHAISPNLNSNQLATIAAPKSTLKACCAGVVEMPWSVVLKALAALLFTALTCVPLCAQALDAANPIGRQTPQQVLDGTATVAGHYSPEQKLRLVIAIKPPHMEEEEQFLTALETKASPEFHQYLAADEWNARFAPSAADEQAVVDWATSQGLTVIGRYANRLIVDVEAPAGVIEKAFGVTINRYQVGEEINFSNDRDPVIPDRLADIVTAVLGLNSIERLHSSMMDGSAVKGPDYSAGPLYAEGETDQADSDGSLDADGYLTVRPEITGGFYDPTNIYSSQAYDYRALYNQGHCCNPRGNPGTSPPDTSIAIAAFGVYNPSDLAGFHKQYPYLAYKTSIIYIGGATACCSDEATLDVEWSTAMSNSFGAAADTSHVFFYVGANNLVSTFTSMYNRMISDNHARVMSTSWGGAEVYGWPVSAINAVHPIFNTMVGQGWTLVAASGDSGATDDCAHDSVDYPASDPDFIAAGGTTLELYSNGDYDSEIGWQGNTGPKSCATNHGGSGGGNSAVFAQPPYQSGFSGSRRKLPDLALNANVGQNYYFSGGLHGVGGTSIVAPELAGFFAQENAYLLSIGDKCGSKGTSACAPLGNANYAIYEEGMKKNAAHDPFYDITAGCNSNDITLKYGLSYDCAGKGYDMVTGWGSANMLQLAWAINWEVTTATGILYVTFTGPATNKWYNDAQIVKWKINDFAGTGLPSSVGTGIAGFTQGWDSIPSDPSGEAHPGGGNLFYAGPQYRNDKNGCLSFASGGGCKGGVSQGCHTVHVHGWNNQGWTTAGQSGYPETYGPLCYDTIAPATTIATVPGNTSVKVTLTATDPGSDKNTGSGVTKTYYSVDKSTCTSGALSNCTVYSSSFTITARGSHTVLYFSEDRAGNFEREKSHTLTVP
jgi:subtilase family serine protease